MKILFVHQNFPGQFVHLATALEADSAHQVVAIGDAQEAGKRNSVPGVRLVCYATPPDISASTHLYARSFEEGVRRGQQACRAAVYLRESGFVPDLIVCHMGWGEGLYLKDVFPHAKLLGYFELFYRTHGAHVHFDPEFPDTIDDDLRIQTGNALHLLSLTAADWGASPTRWQRSLFPAEFQSKISVLPDGIDTDAIAPDPGASLRLEGYGRLTRQDEVITFVSRGFEPYRGIHTFIRALPAILARHPKAQVIAAGTDEVHYGEALPSGTYRRRYLDEIAGQADLSRVHFVGWLSRAQLTRLLQISSAHIYLTYPFVLSWSMLEAMSAGALVIGSRTAPVQDVIEHERNGLLVDFFQPLEVADAVDRILNHPDRLQALRDAARATAEQDYALKSVCLPRQRALLEALLQNRLPERRHDRPGCPSHAT